MKTTHIARWFIPIRHKFSTERKTTHTVYDTMLDSRALNRKYKFPRCERSHSGYHLIFQNELAAVGPGVGAKF